MQIYMIFIAVIVIIFAPQIQHLEKYFVSNRIGFTHYTRIHVMFYKKLVLHKV